MQSILIHTTDSLAIINGEQLKLGQKVAGMRLVKIAENEVVLLAGGERRTLKLFPGVMKQVARVPGIPQSRR